MASGAVDFANPHHVAIRDVRTLEPVTMSDISQVCHGLVGTGHGRPASFRPRCLSAQAFRHDQTLSREIVAMDSAILQRQDVTRDGDLARRKE